VDASRDLKFGYLAMQTLMTVFPAYPWTSDEAPQAFFMRSGDGAVLNEIDPRRRRSSSQRIASFDFMS